MVKSAPALIGASLVGAAFTLAACSDKPAPCLPAEAAVWTPQDRSATVKAATGPVDVYVDGSGSMAGFIRGATAADRPLQDLVARLPWIAGSAAEGRAGTSYALFGRTIHPVAAGRETSLATDAPYACTGAAKGACDNQESRLDTVLQKIKAQPADRLAVVVTDLWLSGADLPGGPTALGAPLSEMLQAGRSLGVLGIKAPYKGLIYDVPNAPPYAGASGHPLFVLLIGPVDRVAAFHDRLTRAGEGAAVKQGANWSLFTLSPGLQPSADARPLKVAPGRALSERPALPPRPDLSVQQLRLSRTVAIRAAARGERGSGEAVFTAAPDTSMRPGAVWRGALTPVTFIWRLKSPGAICHAKAWTPVGAYTGGWTQGPQGARFTLKPEEAASQLPAGKTYLLVGGLKRNGLESPNAANRWMRGWSMNASTAPAVLASKPAFFPTLNLADTADLLEQSLDQAASARAGEVAGFAAVVKAEN